MKPIHPSILILVTTAGLTSCLTRDKKMADIEPFPEGPWGRTFVTPPPPPPPPAPPPVAVTAPRPEPRVEAALAPAPEKEKKFNLFRRTKGPAPELEESDSEEAKTVRVSDDGPTPAPEPTLAPKPVTKKKATSAPAPEPETEVKARLVPEPDNERWFGFLGRRKEPEAGASHAPEPEPVRESRAQATGPTPTVSFVDNIKPIFQEKCVSCHNRDTLHGRVSLESRQLAFQAGPAGPVIVPGNPEGSVLLRNVVTSKTKENAMPPVGHRVTRKEKDLLYAWIMEGARWPDGPEGQIVPEVTVRE